MTHEPLSSNGPVFSRIIAGVWRWSLPDKEVEALINRSMEEGLTTFDHADIYGDYQNEAIFGKVLERTPSLRNRMQLITKCGINNISKHRPSTWIKAYDTSYKHIVWSAENSLKMLHTDHIDLLLIHRPDPLLDPNEVARAFTHLKSTGKVLHFGVSNFTIPQFEVLQSYLDFQLVANQIEISLTHHKPLFDGSLDNLMRHRVAPMAWSPLGGGGLVSNPGAMIFDKAARYHVTPAQLLLAWLLRLPSRVFPVIGTTNLNRIKEAAGALNITLDTQDWFDMLRFAQGKTAP
jgi:predicted oxidoreductase